MLANISIAPLEIVGKITDHLTNLAGSAVTQGTDSLIQVSQVARVEPITLVDQRAQNLPYIVDVMQSLNSIFAGYYLQAVALSVPVGRVNVIKLLDRIAPERLGWKKQLFDKFDVATESLDKLPDFSKEDLGFEAINYAQSVRDSLKNKSINIKVDGPEKTDADDKKKTGRGMTSIHKDANALINESVNLSVGKMLEVEISDNGQKAVFPITVRLLATILDPQTLVHILSDNSRDTSFAERWHGWKAGELKFWRDLILCQDLIEEHRKAMIKDSSNVHSDIMARRRRNAQAAIASGTPSAANASNLAVLTMDTAKELERKIGGRLKDFHVRKRVFDSTYLMIMAVVDPEWEHVTFYHNGIAAATTLSLSELKNSNKGNGPDVMEVLKAFQLGSAPAL